MKTLIFIQLSLRISKEKVTTYSVMLLIGFSIFKAEILNITSE